MKTLYLSDLDGTLLNKDAELSSFSSQALKELIARDVFVSVATARTAATCDRILSGIPIPVPVILMNGVLIYQLTEKRYWKKELLSQEQIQAICEAMHHTGLDGFLYTLEGQQLSTYYEQIANQAMKGFMEERIRKYGKQFFRVPDFRETRSDVIYLCFMDTRERIHRLYDEIKHLPGLRIEKYEDIYSEEPLWYMEVFSGNASKFNAVQYLKSRYGFDQVISFGDNLNDLPMFRASDKCYAVRNAKTDVKNAATAVIGTNTEDSVVRKIAELEGISLPE